MRKTNKIERIKFSDKNSSFSLSNFPISIFTPFDHQRVWDGTNKTSDEIQRLCTFNQISWLICNKIAWTYSRLSSLYYPTEWKTGQKAEESFKSQLKKRWKRTDDMCIVISLCKIRSEYKLRWHCQCVSTFPCILSIGTVRRWQRQRIFVGSLFGVACLHNWQCVHIVCLCYHRLTLIGHICVMCSCGICCFPHLSCRIHVIYLRYFFFSKCFISFLSRFKFDNFCFSFDWFRRACRLLSIKYALGEHFKMYQSDTR